MTLDLNAYASQMTGALARKVADRTKARTAKVLVPVDAVQMANANAGDRVTAELAVRAIPALSRSDAAVKALASALASLAAAHYAQDGGTKASLIRATDGVMQAVQAAGGTAGARELIEGLARTYKLADPTRYDAGYRAYLMVVAGAQVGLRMLEAAGAEAQAEAAKAEAARQAQAAADAKAAKEAAKVAAAARLAAGREAKAALALRKAI